MTFKSFLEISKRLAILVISVIAFFAMLFSILYIALLFCQAISGGDPCSM